MNAPPPSSAMLASETPASEIPASQAMVPAPDAPPFRIHRDAGAPARPLVFASPHSGRLYPEEMLAASALDAAAIRRSEDVLVDGLVLGAVRHGAAVLTAGYARAYIDVNREAYDLDPSMFEDELPDFARGRSPRVAAGLGSIARIVAEGQEIYARKLTFAEASQRIETIHKPYHAALQDLMAEARAAFGCAVLVDWHSMPAAAARHIGAGSRACDIVLGDRFGSACAPRITALVEQALEAMGYRVSRNTPYAGGYTTETYGRPQAGDHALQIEINRALYLDESRLSPHAGFGRVRADLERVFAALAGLDFAVLGAEG
ncbi:MAG: N-formylglutamate amidohydrolase [Caulobacteraceae bacterium]|nr:N-formylglutamate amidohydrolase [Caulobacteraceae bacterium]